MSTTALPGETQKGLKYDEEGNIVIPFTQYMARRPGADTVCDALTAATEVVPNDRQSALVRTYTAPTTAQFRAAARIYSDTADIQLPDVLESITVTFNQNKGEGNHAENGGGISAGQTGNLTLSLNSRAQSSIAILPDIQPNIKRYYTRNLSVTKVLFYMTGASITQAAMLTELGVILGSTVLAWPVFRPVAHTLTLNGFQLSLSADADVQQHVSWNSSNVTRSYGQGTGKSYDAGVSVKTVRLPETIHGAISLATPTKTDKLKVKAEAGWTSEGTAANWPLINSVSDIESAELTAFITPGTLAATSPAAIPTSGLYLYESPSALWKYGATRFLATIVDFSTIS